MIPEVRLEENCAFIPLLGSINDFVCIKWNEDEDSVTNFENEKYRRWCTLRSNICLDESYRHHGEPRSTTQILNVYEIQDSNSGKDYLLVALNEINDCDDIRHCVALPYNHLNLIKFYKDYVMTFPDQWVDEEEGT